MLESGMRMEWDSLGACPVPEKVYWGVHTARAVDNFPISGQTVSCMADLVRALAFVKKAAAQVNGDLGLLDTVSVSAIHRACDELIEGKLHDQFVVDVIQGGAGTSSNLNANEVICNRALEHMGYLKGNYEVLHPNDHVNASQSTHDVYPRALRTAACFGLTCLIEALAELRETFEGKAAEFSRVLKIGRTQLQDAVPMTLGQEFMAFAVMIGEDESRLREARSLIEEVNLGVTAIGTGINAPADYGDLAVRYLQPYRSLPVQQSPNLIETTQDTGAFVPLSGTLKRVGCKLSKVCNDLRLLSSGPQAGFGDTKLPARPARPSCSARSAL